MNNTEQNKTQNFEEDIIEIDLREYARLLWNRKWIIIGLVVAAMVTSFFISNMMTRIYQTSTLIMVQEDEGAESLFSEQISFAGSQTNKLATYSKILKSRRILNKVIKRLELKNEEDELIKPHSLEKSISVTQGNETDLLTVTVTYPDPVVARDIANTLVEVFRAENQEMNQADLNGAYNFITEQLNSVKAQLSELEEELLSYKEKNEIVYPEKQGKNLLDQLTEMETGKEKAKLKLEQSQASLNRLQEYMTAEDKMIITTRTISKNPVVSDSKSRLAELQLELSGLKEVYTDKHPKVKEIKAKIQEVKGRLNEAVSEIVNSKTESFNPVYQSMKQKIINLQTTIITSQVQLDTYSQQISSINKQLKGLPEKELKLARLEREQKVTENIYLMLRERKEEVQIQRSMKTSDIVVIDPAVVHEQPIKPNIKLNMVIAVFLAIFVGIAIIFLLEYLDTTVKEEEELERLTGLPVLGVVPEVSSVEHSSGYGRNEEQE